MMRTLWETGLRASEIVQLGLGDIQPDAVYVAAGNGSHSRWVPISSGSGEGSTCSAPRKHGHHPAPPCCSLPAIIQMLGYTSLDSTARYLGCDIENLRAAMEKHPRHRSATLGDAATPRCVT